MAPDVLRPGNGVVEWGSVVNYRERLAPGPGVLLACLLLLPALLLVCVPISMTLGIVVAPIATAALIAALMLSAPVVEVRDGVLRAGPARIPAHELGEGEALRGALATAARGPELDARAWCLIRGWIDPVVRLTVTDLDDPAPYWLISTRRPDELIGALAAARTRA